MRRGPRRAALIAFLMVASVIAARFGMPPGPRASKASECIPPTPFVSRAASPGDVEAAAFVSDIFFGRAVERGRGFGLGTPVHGDWDGLEFVEAFVTVEVEERLKGTATGLVRIRQPYETMECEPIPLDPPLRANDIGLFFVTYVARYDWYFLAHVDAYFLVDDDCERTDLARRFSAALGTPVATPAQGTPEIAVSATPCGE